MAKSTDLSGKTVLICEDETWIALDLACAVEDAGGAVIGPFASVAATLEQLAETTPDAAILDVNLIDGDCLPIIEKLSNFGGPIVVQSGRHPPAGFGALKIAVRIKPVSADDIISALHKS